MEQSQPQQDAFQPQDEHIFLRTASGLSQRILFSGMPRTELEDQHWQAYLLQFPDTPAFYKENNMLIRYLQASKWDYQKTYTSVIQHQEWKLNTKPELLPERGHELLNRGFMYVCNRDKHFRPVIVMNCQVTKTFTPKDYEDIPASINHFLQYSVDKVMVRGKAETQVLIIDMDNMGMTEIPVNLLRTFLSSAQTNFRGTSYRIYIVNAGYFIRGSFSIFRMMVDEFTQMKIIMMGNDFKQELVKVIDAERLEVKFGGTLQNKTSDFFPPSLI